MDLVRALAPELRGLDRRVGIWLSVLGGMTVGVVLFSVLYPIQFVGLDFQAFWCGGAVLLAHANPYLNQPLHACEAAHSPAFLSAYPNVTIPVPLPPYAIALFAPLSLIPFSLARVLWWITLAVAAFAVGRGIAKISGMPPVTAVAASYLAVLGPAIFPGALAPIPIALTVFAALALQQRRWNLAAIFLGSAMIEPHMVMPACLAVFLFMPHMRLRLVTAALVIALVTFAAVGPVAVFSYVTVILPTHALAEVNNLAQYSLTAFLYHLGVSPHLAVHIGSLQYALFAIVGMFAARNLYRASLDPAWLVLVPAGFAVVGGPFIHLDQIAMVVPMACLIVRSRPSRIAVGVLIMLAIPIEVLINWLPFTIPAAMICGWLVAQSRPDWKRTVAASGLVVVASCGMVALLILGNHAMTATGHVLAHPIHVSDPGPNASASVSWGEFTSFATFLPWIWWPEKVLTIVPVLALVVLTLREAFGKSRSAGEPERSGALNVEPYALTCTASPGSY